MNCRNTSEKYGSVSKFFHWLIFIFFIIQIIVALSMGNVPKSVQSYFYTFHKSLGLLILLAAFLFIVWNLSNLKPQWPGTMPKWERISARTIHLALYTLILLMPISGWLMSTAAGHPPNFFWLVQIPMPGIVKNKALAQIVSNIHSLLAWILCTLVGIHILAALKHHFITKDNILTRIWPGG